MPGHKIGTRDEWQAARNELAKLEEEHAERNEEIKRKRLELPWVAVAKEYEFDTDDGKNLLAGYKRATNIIRIEEKKDGREYVERPDPALYRQDEERALSRAIDIAKEEAAAAVAREDFEAAMHAMAKLRPHVDAFFDKVTVNVAEGADREKLRENRLKLLNEIRDATRTVADFSRIEG